MRDFVIREFQRLAMVYKIIGKIIWCLARNLFWWFYQVMLQGISTKTNLICLMSRILIIPNPPLEKLSTVQIPSLFLFFLPFWWSHGAPFSLSFSLWSFPMIESVSFTFFNRCTRWTGPTTPPLLSMKTAVAGQDPVIFVNRKESTPCNC